MTNSLCGPRISQLSSEAQAHGKIFASAVRHARSVYILGRAFGRLVGHRQTHPCNYNVRSCGAAARIAAAIVLEDGVGRLAPIGHTAALERVAARLMKSQRIHSTSCCTVAAAKKRQGSVVRCSSTACGEQGCLCGWCLRIVPESSVCCF